jgi:hypothetical protein
MSSTRDWLRCLLGVGALALAPLLHAQASGPSTTTSDALREAEGRSDADARPDAAMRAVRPGDPRRPSAALDGFLLIPDSTGDRVMAFNPNTGALVNANFIPTDSTHLATPKAAILKSTATTILVSDQVNDVVQEYLLNGTYVGVFAPAGGVNTAILDNILGLTYRPNGNLLVTVTGGANQDSVAEFNAAGTHVGNFIAIGAGGLDGPFDLVFRNADVLVSSINSDQILRYDRDTGAFLGVFAAVNNFPQQIALAANGNVLVANFGGTQEGILEYQADGTFVARITVAGLSGYRGVYELPTGNLLVTTGTGVYEISRAGVLVEAKITGVSAQYIELAPGIEPVELHRFTIE